MKNLLTTKCIKGFWMIEVSLLTIENDIFKVRPVAGFYHLNGSNFIKTMGSRFIEMKKDEIESSTISLFNDGINLEKNYTKFMELMSRLRFGQTTKSLIIRRTTWKRPLGPEYVELLIEKRQKFEDRKVLYAYFLAWNFLFHLRTNDLTMQVRWSSKINRNL